MQGFQAFSEEYQSIFKEATVSQLVGGGLTAMKGTFNAARKGWAGKGLADPGTQGLSGFASAGKNYWNALGKTDRGRALQTGAKTIGLGAGVAGAGVLAGRATTNR